VNNDILHESEKLPAELVTRAQSELTSDERLVWIGRPHLGAVLRSEWVLIVFGLVFTVGPVLVALIVMNFMTRFARSAEAVLVFFALLTMGILGILCIALLLWSLLRSRRSWYALTDKRAIVCEGAWFADSTSSYTAEGLVRMKRRERRNGSGDLIFVEIMTISTNSEGRASTSTRWRGFLNVTNVREVEKLVRSTLLSGR
jgi:hypothetical protein